MYKINILTSFETMIQTAIRSCIKQRIIDNGYIISSHRDNYGVTTWNIYCRSGTCQFIAGVYSSDKTNYCRHKHVEAAVDNIIAMITSYAG